MNRLVRLVVALLHDAVAHPTRICVLVWDGQQWRHKTQDKIDE